MSSNIQSTTLTGLSGVARRLVAEGALSESDARKASEASSKQRVSLIAYLIENGLADPKMTAAAASQEFGVPLFDASAIDLRQTPIKSIEQALIDRRVYSPKHDKAQEEFRRLEFDPKKKKIDHPSNGSKDLSDAMASVIFGLTMMSETWIGHHIPISEAPIWLKQLEQASRNKSSTEGRIGE